MGKKRTLAKTLLMAAASVVLGLGALLWFGGSETALRWVAQRAVAASQGRLSLQGVHGSLYGPLRVDRMVFDTPQRRLELDKLALNWRPWALLQRRLVIEKCHLQALTVNIKASAKEPLQPPRTLRLPFSLALPQATVGRIRVTMAGASHDLRQLRLRLYNSGDAYRLALLGVDTPWGDAQGALKLAVSAPFSLQGRVVMGRKKGRLPYTVRLLLQGTLGEISAAATGSAGPMAARGKAVFTPFRALPVKALELTARGIDPARWGDKLPHADMALAVHLATKSDGTLGGTFHIDNGDPGSLDQKRLPLKRLTGAVAGSVKSLQFRDLLADLGRAGRLRGSGDFSAPRLRLDVATGNLNLRGFYGKCVHTRLRGGMVLRLDAKAQTLLADLSQKGYRFKLDLARQEGRLLVRSARVRSGRGTLEVRGELALAGKRVFRARATLKRFNPAQFGDYPDAQVNAIFAASGTLMPQWRTALEFSVRNSRWRGRPLSATGGLDLSASRIRKSNVVLRLAANRLSASGAFGRSGDRLRWQLDASRLGDLGPQFGGSVAASGTLRGTWAQPSGSFALNGRHLRWTDRYRIAHVRANGRLGKGGDGRLTLAAALTGSRFADFALAEAGLKAQGSRAHHRLQLTARNGTLDMAARLSGGWQAGGGWSGWLQSLRNRGPYALTLKAPARLAVDRQGFVLRQAALNLVGADITINKLSRQGGRWASSGEASGLRVDKLPGLVAATLQVKGTLMLGGKWAITAGESLDGSLSLWRQGGDLAPASDSMLTLGLTRLSFHTAAVAGRLSATLDAQGARLGTLSAQGQTTVSRKDGAWGLAGNAPLRLEADANVPSIAWLGPLIDGNPSLEGALEVHLRATGTVAVPRLGGTIEGDKLRLAVPEQGIDFKDGSLRAELHNNTLLLKRMVLRAGKGTLTATGSAALAQGVPRVQLALTADRLEALARPDRHLVVSGKAQVSLHARQLAVTGKLKADQGLVELPKADTPTLSQDVVVLGRSSKTEKKGRPYRMALNVDVDLGDRFYLKGRGVDAQLTGVLRVHAKDSGLPQALGTIRVVKGSYVAYGQRLAIERGEINFTGPIDNPGLDIVALRKNQPVEAGVAITGSAMAPHVSLVSKPTVADSEKLSWLVLGHGLESAGGADFSLMQAAAGALLSQGKSVTLQSEITQATGLDEFGLRGAGGLEGTVLTLGKRLSSRVYVSYQQSLRGATNLAKINLTLSKRLSLRAQTGSDSAMDLFYTFSFD